VYKARQTRLHRLVALKMILAGSHAGPEELARFRREAAAVARLQHPHIVQIYAVGEAEGRPYFALEFLEGGSLADKLDGTPLPSGPAAQLVETLARAMQAAHQRGIVHRDLKPANVLLSADGTPKIADFGLAKQLQGEPGASAPGSPTQSGAIMGTPSYMAPEQAQGQSKQIGPAADVYALGAILYELLTGRPPFKAPTPLDTMLQVLGAEPVPPSRFQKVPRDLETICLRCLQKEPRKRYASALDLADDLARFLEGEPIRARPVGWAERAVKWVRRRPTLAAAYGLVLLLLAGGAVGAAVALVQIADAKDKETAAKDKETAARRDAQKRAKANLELARREQTQRKSARREAALLALDQALKLGEEGDARRGLLWLVRTLELARSAADPHLEAFLRTSIAAWRRQLVPLAASFPWPGPNRQCVVSLDKRTALSWSPGAPPRLVLWEVTSGRAVASLAVTSPVQCAAFSNDGRILATGHEDGLVRRWEAHSGKAAGSPLRHPGAVTALAFSPDGKRLLTAAGAASLWDLPSGKAIRASFPQRDKFAVVGVDFSPRGQTFMTYASSGPGQSGEARLWDASSYQPLGEPITHDGTCTCSDYSPDGKFLLTAGWNEKKGVGEVRLWDAGRGRLLGKPAELGPMMGLYGMSFYPGTALYSPDGRTAALLCDKSVLFFWVNPSPAVDGIPFWLLERRQHPEQINSLAYSPDGAHVATASADGTAQIWEADTGLPLGESLEHPGQVDRAEFGPGGRFLWTVSQGTVRQWELKSAKPEQALISRRRPYPPPLSDVQLSPANRFAIARQKIARQKNDDEDDECAVNLYEVATGRRVAELFPPDFDTPFRVAFSPDNRTVMVASSDGPVRQWDLATGKPVGPPLQLAKVSGVAFSPDGKRFVTGTRPGQVQFWDTATARPVGRPFPAPAGATRVALSKDGRMLVVGCADGKVQSWDVVSRRPRGRTVNSGANFADLALSPDGRTLLTWVADRVLGGKTLKVWDVASGRRVLSALKSANVIAFSPDGKTALVGSGELSENRGEARFYSTATWEPFGLPLPHNNMVAYVAFAPDGRLAVTGTGRGVIRFWDVALTRPLGPPLHYPGLCALGFQPDGRTAIAVNPSGFRSFRVPAAVTAPPERLRLWAQTVTGFRMDAGGGVAWMAAEDWEQSRRQLRQGGGPVCEEPTMTAPVEERRPRLSVIAVAPAG
jgi:WD40 repeat protein